MIEQSRRSLLASLNTRWIYGTIPLLHLIMLLLEMAAVSLLVQKFNGAYAKKPILTTMITNAILGGIADTTAQLLTAFQKRPSKRSGKKDGLFESYEMEKRGSWPAGDVPLAKQNRPPPFDFERLTRFMAYGFLLAPIQHKWFSFLSRTFPINSETGITPAFKRVAFDQFLFAPVGLSAFFIFMTIAEGGGKRALGQKFRDVYMPALKANFILWPGVQILNFSVMPLPLQIPFVSTIGIFWTAYLSLTNASDDLDKRYRSHSISINHLDHNTYATLRILTTFTLSCKYTGTTQR